MIERSQSWNYTTIADSKWLSILNKKTDHSIIAQVWITSTDTSNFSIYVIIFKDGEPIRSIAECGSIVVSVDDRHSDNAGKSTCSH